MQKKANTSKDRVKIVQLVRARRVILSRLILTNRLCVSQFFRNFPIYPTAYRKELMEA